MRTMLDPVDRYHSTGSILYENCWSFRVRSHHITSLSVQLSIGTEITEGKQSTRYFALLTSKWSSCYRAMCYGLHLMENTNPRTNNNASKSSCLLILVGRVIFHLRFHQYYLPAAVDRPWKHSKEASSPFYIEWSPRWFRLQLDGQDGFISFCKCK